MGTRVLKTAPFYLPPYAEGWVSSRYVGWLAIVLDASFAALALVLVALIFECGQNERWNRRAIIAVLSIASLLAVGYWSAEMVSVHL
jgi:hypothetical protein